MLGYFGVSIIHRHWTLTQTMGSLINVHMWSFCLYILLSIITIKFIIINWCGGASVYINYSLIRRASVTVRICTELCFMCTPVHVYRVLFYLYLLCSRKANFNVIHRHKDSVFCRIWLWRDLKAGVKPSSSTSPIHLVTTLDLDLAFKSEYSCSAPLTSPSVLTVTQSSHSQCTLSYPAPPKPWKFPTTIPSCSWHIHSMATCCMRQLLRVLNRQSEHFPKRTGKHTHVRTFEELRREKVSSLPYCGRVPNKITG